MELRTAASPKDVKYYTTERLREEFLIKGLFTENEIKLVYSHIDRIITGGAMPVSSPLVLTAGEELRAEYFLQRREMGVINIGGAGTITIDGISLTVAKVTAQDFSVSIIPHTAAQTTLSLRRVGDIVNLENDVIGKYVEKLLHPAEAPTKPETKDTSITMDFLKKYGF